MQANSNQIQQFLQTNFPPNMSGPPEEDLVEKYKDVKCPVERRRLQNREASARFRARGKARELEVRTVQWQVNVMVQRVSELDELNLKLHLQLTQDAAVAQVKLARRVYGIILTA